MRIVTYGFKDPVSEVQMRSWGINRMLAGDRRRPLLRHFLEWTSVPGGAHLFDWLHIAHGIDTGFIFSNLLKPAASGGGRSWASLPPGWAYTMIPVFIDDPLDLMIALSDHGHDFGKWTAAYLRPRGELPIPAIFFSEATDAVLFRLHYGEQTELC